MSRRQIQYMMRNPKAMMDFQTRGVLPSEKRAPSTALRDLIEKIPPRLRVRFRGISLHPDLGFRSNQRFDNLEQLFTWLGGNQTLIGGRTMPYMSWSNKGFRKQLTVNDLLPFCSDYPTKEVLEKTLPKRIYTHD